MVTHLERCRSHYGGRLSSAEPLSRPQTACRVLPTGQRSTTQCVEACQPAAAGHGSDAGAPRWRVRRRAGARASRSGRAGRPESPARCRAGACCPPWPALWRQAALAAQATWRPSRRVALPRAQVQRTGSCGYATRHPTRQQLPDTVGMQLTASNPPAGALAPSETAPMGHRSSRGYKLPLLARPALLHRHTLTHSRSRRLTARPAAACAPPAGSAPTPTCSVGFSCGDQGCGTHAAARGPPSPRAAASPLPAPPPPAPPGTATR